MPIFEYKCNSCGEEFEKLVFGSTLNKDIVCEKCGSEDVFKMISNLSSVGNSSSSESSFKGCGHSHGGFS